jgi:hypothetical protein
VFNMLERIVTREYGEDTWDDLLDASGLDGAYTSLGSYDDADLGKLVSAASAELRVADGEERAARCGQTSARSHPEACRAPSRRPQALSGRRRA